MIILTLKALVIKLKPFLYPLGGDIYEYGR